MKLRSILWILCASLLLPSPAFPQGKVISDGGGEPLLIHAKPYPDPEALDRAGQIIVVALKKLSLSDELKSEVEQELNSLREGNKYKVLPFILSRGEEDDTEGYPEPEELTHFYSLGAMTRFWKGAYVFFAQRVTEYEDSHLERVLLHEVLHHVLPQGSIRNEKFVETAARAILSGELTPAIRAGLIQGLVVRENFVSGRSLAYWIAGAFKGDEGSSEKYQALEARILNAMPVRAENLTVQKLISEIAHGSICSAIYPIYARTCIEEKPKHWLRIHERVFELARLVDPTNALADGQKYDSMYCKHAITGKAWIAGDRCKDDMLLVRDLFDWARLNIN